MTMPAANPQIGLNGLNWK